MAHRENVRVACELAERALFRNRQTNIIDWKGAIAIQHNSGFRAALQLHTSRSLINIKAKNSLKPEQQFLLEHLHSIQQIFGTTP